MVLCEDKYIAALERILRRTDYVFLIKAMRGLGDSIDPWYDYASMEFCIAQSHSPHKAALRLLQMGVGADCAQLCEELGQTDVDLLVEAGLWRREGERVETNNLVVLTVQGLRVLTEINPWFDTCTNRNTDVYIGSDSLRLAENIAFARGAEVLDLCSGTSIQGLLAARSARRVVSVEINPKVVPVARFNIRLNHLEDVVDLREGDLYAVLGPEERFDYIYANPPFIPMVDDVAYPMCGSGGEDGLMVLNRIFDGLPARLKPDGEAIVFCECLGERSGAFFDRRVEALGRENGWRVNVLYNNRIPADLQIKRMAALTVLFNEGLDTEAFGARMAEVYRRLGARYLYSLLYKVDACGAYAYRRLDRCNPWDARDGATVEEGLALAANPDNHALLLDGEQIGACNNETADILRLLKAGHSVDETATALWDTYKGKAKYRDGYASFVQAMLGTCLKMEGLGAIARRENNARD